MKLAAKGPGTAKLAVTSKPTKPSEVKKVKAPAISKKPKVDVKSAKTPSKTAAAAAAAPKKS